MKSSALKKPLALAMCAVFLLPTSLAHGTDVFLRQANVVQVVPSIQYFVGAPIRQQAISQYAQADVIKNLLERIQALEAKIGGSGVTNPGKGVLSTNPIDSPLPSLFNRACLKCHSANNKDTDLDLRGVLNSDLKLKAIRAIVTGKMPKGDIKLTPQQAGDLIEYLSK